jgi:hypothetical protein
MERERTREGGGRGRGRRARPAERKYNKSTKEIVEATIAMMENVLIACTHEENYHSHNHRGSHSHSHMEAGSRALLKPYTHANTASQS